MFARFQTVSSPHTDDLEARRGELTDILRRHAGYGGAYFMVSGPTAMRALVTLWATEEDARAASERTRAATGDTASPVTIHEDTVYEVTEDEPGPAADAEPTVAAVAAFDGPFSDAGRDAMDRIHGGKVIPAVRALPGTVRLLFLWDRLSRSMRGLHLATDAAPLDAAGPAVDATDPAAGEDPALISPPDRVERWAVGGADVPVTGASARP
ncbi:hypothetical protein EV188_101988 [Actinomycetospora succinea]|uniref:Antibiotic biosynthesis monooxygenase n=1 Tax=Actinomycetospora succinea TaxID=663603 RepID=A0A4R6VSW7_9PSEU|nr:hypothetical protein [Actinomycetospora succinea]TDQ65736.1 hypothetical protein EV188_101988 [Actinomycetospora succinea]